MFIEEQNLTDDQKKIIKEIGVPVLIAGFSMLAGELARLFVDEIRSRYFTKKPEPEKQEQKPDAK